MALNFLYILIGKYKIIRNFRYGKDLNVYKAYEANNNKPRVHYVIKSYKTREAFEIESETLEILKDAKVNYFGRVNQIFKKRKKKNHF